MRRKKEEGINTTGDDVLIECEMVCETGLIGCVRVIESIVLCEGCRRHLKASYLIPSRGQTISSTTKSRRHKRMHQRSDSAIRSLEVVAMIRLLHLKGEGGLSREGKGVVRGMIRGDKVYFLMCQ